MIVTLICKQRSFNKGVALITAMMVMSLATITAIQMTADQQIYFRRTSNILLHEQAFMYALSAETVAKVGLAQDFNDNQIDSYADDIYLYNDAPPISLEGAAISAHIEDLQGYININNFASDPISPVWVDRLNTILSNYSLPSDIADVIIDWIDANNSPLPNGAESVDYLSGDTPYRAADRMMGSISELKLLKEIDDDAYNALKEVFVALPTTNLNININTAPPAVLRVIVPGLSDADAEMLAEDLKDNPLNDPSDLGSHSLVRGAQIVYEGLGVESDYYLLKSTVAVDRATTITNSYIYRQNADNIQVVLRSQGGL